MPPRPAPDLVLRRHQLVREARILAEDEGWSAVTMRRVATRLGATQPVVYSAFASRQALVDAVAVEGFGELAAALQSARATPADCLRAYLNFAITHPRTYEAMFSMPTGLPFATEQTPPPLQAAFAVLQAAVADGDATKAEVVWAMLHGLATLSAADRLRDAETEARFVLALRLTLENEVHPGRRSPPQEDDSAPSTRSAASRRGS